MDSDAKDLADGLLVVFTPIVGLATFAIAGPAAAIVMVLIAILVGKSMGVIIANHFSQRSRILEQRRLLAASRLIERQQNAAEAEKKVAGLRESASVSPAQFPK